jgi:SAM-dependent methyltransferase
VTWTDALLRRGRSGWKPNLPPPADLVQEDSWVDFEGVELARSLAEYASRDPHPIPAPEDREGYFGDRHFDYWLLGLRDFLCVERLLGLHGAALAPGHRVLDFGCASGRVLRHFLCQAEGLDVWGTDFDPLHVRWIERFLGPRPRVFTNHALPSLPLADASFELVCAFSVFTHIDDFEMAWLAELSRILAPGGFAYLTFHSEHTWSRLTPSDHLHQILVRDTSGSVPELRLGRDMFERPLPSERVVFFTRRDEPYGCNVFHTTDYVRSVWGRWLEVVEVVRGGHAPQDVVLLRKPDRDPRAVRA